MLLKFAGWFYNGHRRPYRRILFATWPYPLSADFTSTCTIQNFFESPTFDVSLVVMVFSNGRTTVYGLEGDIVNTDLLSPRGVMLLVDCWKNNENTGGRW